MSIIRPHKLGIIAGPGSEYLTGKILKHLKSHYLKRYSELSKNLTKRYGLTDEEVYRQVMLYDDINSKSIHSSALPPEMTFPNVQVGVTYTRFLNGEVKAEIEDPVRGLRLYIIYDMSNSSPIMVKGLDEPMSFSINDHVMFLFTLLNAARLAGADSVTLVLPTYPYARQHKKAGREALSAALFGQLCEFQGVDRIITLDIHCREIENCFTKTHLENLHASYQLMQALNTVADFSDPDVVVVSPDTGAVSRNKFFAQALHRPLAMLYKERDYSIVTKDAKSTNIKAINLLGEVSGKTVIMADDMIASGGTLLIAMRKLREWGAKRVICLVSLPFFNGSALEDFDAAHKDGVFDYVIGTNAVYHDDDFLSRPWFIQADISILFAKIISRLHHGMAISPILDNRQLVQKLVDKNQKSEVKTQAMSLTQKDEK
ncbi:MAG: ribose-phosphate diphosphokinase [Sphaerochaetaceae bacterium]